MKRFAFIFMFGLIMFTLIITSMSMYSQNQQLIEKLDTIESRLPLSNIADEPTDEEIRLRNNTPGTVLYEK